MKLKTFYILLVLFILSPAILSQDNPTGQFRSNPPTSFESGRESYFERGPLFTADMEQRLKTAQENRNTLEAEKLMKEMYSNVPDEYIYKTDFTGSRPEPVRNIEPPFTGDWYTNDVTVFSGDVKYGNPYFRQIDMKMGEDGNIYIAFNRAPISGTTGRIDVYRSSNGGANWVYVQGLQYASGAYIGTVSLLVEQRSDSNNPDSIRVFVFFTKSSTENNDNAVLAYGSWRRTGAGWYAGEIAAPPSGQEFSFVSAASDGAFYNSSTWIGAFCTQSNNALTTTNDFKYYRSLDWGITWTGVTISTAYNDFYPSAELRPSSSFSTDSVWIAVERRITSTQYEIRVIRTPWTPSASSNTYYVTSGGSNIYYEKPALTVKQNRSCDSAMFTTTRDGYAYYFFTTNGGASWSNQANLGGTSNGNNKSFTWCASSPAGPNHFVAIWVSNDGDSLNLRRGVLDLMGTNVYKRNSYSTSTSVSPACMIYNPSAGINYSAFVYAGFGPSNIYTNQENLLTGLEPISTVAEKFELGQNYPNPFNPATTITFSLPRAGYVSLKVYDATGKEAASIINNELGSGIYKVDFNAGKLASGVYFYRLVTDGFSDVKKMILIK